ncbi:MAG TPA: hypothetical protein PKD26_15325 [Pyrinomonadaceae bacterium]|nr:hypothetical protein [Pyrinomonadaceae bacterium]
MSIVKRDIAVYIAAAILLMLASCGGSAEVEKSSVTVETEAIEPPKGFQPATEPSPAMPDLQAELLDQRGRTTTSPLGTFDFRNFTYPLPRGWHHPDGDEITLEDGHLAPQLRDITDEMSPGEKAEARAERRIGMSFVTTKFFDVDNDGEDEAAVVLKIETGGNAIPQLVYIFGWKDGKPELQWNFRTGDRADGGLKDIRAENGELVVELYGQDRFLLGQAETGKITGDEQQLCCPTHFTRSFYKWNGKNFQLQRKRLTYETANPSAQPLENHGDIMNDPVKSREYLKRTNKVKDS